MKETGQRRDVHVRNGREMVAGLTAKRKVRIIKVECQDGERGSEPTSVCGQIRRKTPRSRMSTKCTMKGTRSQKERAQDKESRHQMPGNKPRGPQYQKSKERKKKNAKTEMPLKHIKKSLKFAYVKNYCTSTNYPKGTPRRYVRTIVQTTIFLV